jgi:hypothetical protein
MTALCLKERVLQMLFKALPVRSYSFQLKFHRKGVLKL